MDTKKAIEILGEAISESNDEYTEMMECLLHIYQYREYLGEESKLIPHLKEELIRQALFIEENYEKVEDEDGNVSWEWKE